MATKTPATGLRRIVALLTMSLASLLSLALIALLCGFRRFNRLVRRDVQALFAQSHLDRDRDVTEEMLADLPAPVHRYLTYTGVVGKPLVRTIHLRQKGAMHMSAKQAWIPLDAEQYYSVQPPGFVWAGTMHAGPFPLARGRDMYRNGSGNMLIKAGSLFTVVDGEGEEMDQGAMMRYLSEMIWFPAAFLGDNISFEPVDDKRYPAISLARSAGEAECTTTVRPSPSCARRTSSTSSSTRSGRAGSAPAWLPSRGRLLLRSAAPAWDWPGR